MNTAPIVGTSVPRMEGRDKVTGRARYVDDMELPDMLFGATVRSRIPRGRIKRSASALESIGKSCHRFR